MTKNPTSMLAIVIVILLIGVWLVLPTTHQIPVLNRLIETRLGLDLVGGIQVLLEVDIPQDQAVDSELMTKAVEIVENRVNGLGVNEAVVQRAGERRINVELPGETNRQKALDSVKQTGLLEFVDFSGLTQEQVDQLKNISIKTDYASGQGSTPTSTITPTTTDTGTGAETSTTPISTTQGITETVYHTVMTGFMLDTVDVTTSSVGKPQVAFALTSEGSKLFGDFTASHVGKFLAIVLDKQVISAPVINTAIQNGKGVIEGGFTTESANTLAVQLRYGSLPYPLKIVETRSVGPTLGQDSLKKSMVAGIIGFIVVTLFMLLYYRLPGFVAILSIIYYAIIAYALYRFVPVTLTLPGIAGFLLSTGSALDANILIFERFKEELRSGKKINQALDLGWQRAWPSIRDSNAATIITSLILLWFGSSFGATIVKGFSLTLLFGVLVSLFTAILVTRSFLRTVLDYFKPTNLQRWFGI